MNICIVGTGYVGLVAAACLAEMGNQVACIDVNSEIIAQLQAGKVHIFEPGLEPLVARNVSEGRLTFSTDLAEGMQEALFVFNCVGTPSRPDGSCDLSYVDQVAAQIGRVIGDYKIIVNKSTVPVGTADRVKAIIAGELRQRNLSLEFDVVSNPEFLKEGDAVNDFLKPDRVIVGTDNVRTAKLLEALYAPFARSREKMIVMGIRSAEMTKYAANCMLATKISFMNEVATICEAVGADVREVRAGIGSDRRIGYHFIYPGVGYGGSCFPKDVRALIHTAKESGCTPDLVAAVDAVNNRQKGRLAQKILHYFESRGGVAGRTLALWGLAFKANTDDMRESAALDTIKILTAAGMAVRAFDPVAGRNGRRQLVDNSLVTIVEDQYAPLDGADALAVVTDWNQFRNPDFARIHKSLRQAVI
ncbi:MAG: UDP-glucose/GDP-mannose dehydrogenase family protein, partial [Desulfosarcina sp.]